MRKSSPTILRAIFFKRTLSFIIISITFFLSDVIMGQCMLQQIPFSQKINSANLIVEGKVISKKCYWGDTSQSVIYTSNLIEVFKVLKGVLTSTQIEVITDGGSIGMQLCIVHPSLELSVNDIGVFACTSTIRYQISPLQKSLLPKFEVYAGAQGFFKYDLNTLTASDPFNVYQNVTSDIYNNIRHWLL